MFRLPLILSVMLLLMACGQIGPLYLPTEEVPPPPAATPTEQPAGEVPAPPAASEAPAEAQ